MERLTDFLSHFRIARSRKMVGWLGLAILLAPVAAGHATAWPRLSNQPFRLLHTADQKADPRRNIVKQKLRLLETYFRSSKVTWISKNGSAEGRQLLSDAGRLLEQAQAHFQALNFTEADTALNQGLRLVTRAVSEGAGALPRRESTADQNRYRNRNRQVRLYLEALGKARDSAGDEVRAVVSRVSAFVAESERLAGLGRNADADAVLIKAYRAVVVALSSVRKGQTLVSRLTFETPADELEYERRRNDSYEVLVRTLMKERAASDSFFSSLAGRQIELSRKFRSKADSFAADGDYAGAIEIMESASHQLIRALQAGGLPVTDPGAGDRRRRSKKGE